MAIGQQSEVLLAGIIYGGNALSAGKVYTYAAGTNTLTPVYTDANLTTPAANPIILDSQGRAAVFANGNYKFVVKDASDTLLYTWDNLRFSNVDGTNPSDYVTLAQAQAGIDISSAAASLKETQYSNDSTAANFTLRKSRASAIGGNTIIQNGDQIGGITFSGANGTGFTDGASIRAYVSGAPGASNDMPTELSFWVTPDNSGSPVKRFIIASDGAVSLQSNFVTQTRNSSDAVGAYFLLYKNRNATVGGNTIVQNGDELGTIVFGGANGSGYSNAAAISAAVDGAPGASNDMPGSLRFYTTPDNSGTLTERARFDSSGNFGVATLTPKDALQIRNGTTITPYDSAGGNGSIYGFNHYYSSGSKAILTGNRTVTVEMNNSGGALKSTTATQTADTVLSGMSTYLAWGGSNDIVTISTANTERVRITSTGRVGINTNNPGYALQVGDGTGTVEASINGANSGTAGGAVLSTRVAGTACIAIGNLSSIIGGTYAANPTIWGSGTVFKVVNLTSGAGTIGMKYNTSNQEWTYDVSSAKYKQNIRNSSYGLNAVMQLNPKQFQYKNGGREDVGFIAEEVAQIIPELVPLDTNGQPEAVNYDRLTSVLCKAIQELTVRVQALEARA